jgi:predicted membrane channel-forming protein YqfA (hemolysin III family)
MNPFIAIIVVLIVVGVLIWAAQSILAVLPVAEPFKTVIYVLIVVFAVFFILDVIGLLPSSLSFGQHPLLR